MVSEKDRFFLRLKQEERNAKDQFLMRIGACERIEADEKSREFPHWDDKTGKYYAIVPIQVTDEEFEEIEKSFDRICDYSDEPEGGRNKVAVALDVIAVLVYIGAAIIGLEAIRTSAVTAGAIWGGGFVSGTMMLGFSEIIKLLHKIAEK